MLTMLMGAVPACGDLHDDHDDARAPMASVVALDVAVLTDTNPDPKVVEVALVAGVASVEYLPGKQTAVWAYRDGAKAGSVGSVPGPMIKANRGDEIIVHFRNELPESTTVHWHGLRLPVKMDGSTAAQSAIPTGGAFEYRFRAEDAGTFWFHPHVRADEQIEKGLYAPFVVVDDDGVDATADRMFVLDDVKLTASGELSTQIDALDRMVGRQGNVVLVNGRRGATLEVASGARERWRFVNASNGRFYNLRMPGSALVVIGTDGGLLPAPKRVDSLVIAPGQRYELLVSFDADAGAVEGTRSWLESVHYDRGHDLADEGAKRLFDIVVRGKSARALRPMPAALRAIDPMPIGPTTRVRRFVLEERVARDGPSFSINGESWPFNKAIMVKQGELEIFEIVSPPEMDHPFHLHGMFFQVLGPDGRPDTSEGWKDTVNVKRGTTLRFAVRYEALGMWMFHCHILEHAERGMMGELMVMP